MTGRVCNAREPRGIHRCERPHGHAGEHGTPDGIRWPSHKQERERRRTGTSSRRPMRTHSDPEIERSSYLDGRHDSRIIAMWAQSHPPRVWCERCHRSGPEEHAGLSVAREWLHQHHVIRRSNGRGYRFSDRKPGVDRELEYLCDRCHTRGPEAAHPGLDFGPRTNSGTDPEA